MDDIVLDHVAIAVSNMSNVQKIYKDLGLSFSHEENVSTQKVKTSFAKIDQHSNIELLEATSKESAIAKYIDKKGEGIHHLCFKVKDLNKKITELKLLGYKFIYENPQIGAHHKLVNFIHPRSTNGVLIELCEDQQ